ncbi:hypothetical protein [Crocosphaera sp.]|nr:hypothetical protein [Crocosphaera sp.]
MTLAKAVNKRLSILRSSRDDGLQGWLSMIRLLDIALRILVFDIDKP